VLVFVLVLVAIVVVVVTVVDNNDARCSCLVMVNSINAYFLARPSSRWRPFDVIFACPA
jgi:hypothetical protein